MAVLGCRSLVLVIIIIIIIIVLYHPCTGFLKTTRSSFKSRPSNSDDVFYCNERIFSYRIGFPTLTFDSG